jgi:hypothetical protein
MKNKNHLIFFLFVIFILTTSCRHNISQIEISLIRSGDNRPELEKVIEHYSQNKQDSLKLKAAMFLIENMPIHLSLFGERVLHYQNEFRELLNDNVSEDQLFEVIEKFNNEKDIISEDINIISSDILIRNIDQAFDAWQSKPWCRHINFDEFCEYILPYKYAE